MGKRLALAVFCLFGFLMAAGCQGQVQTVATAAPDKAKIIKVTDGDTYVVSYQGRQEKLRLIGVNTPELHHPQKGVEVYGQEAYEYSKQQLLQQEVRLELDVEQRDRYGRLLAYVYKEDKMFNLQLVEAGYAQVMTVPPNVKYAERFKAAQRVAFNKQRGLWGEASYNDQGRLVGSKKGNKYHRPDCKWAQKIKPANRTWFNDVAAAMQQGYEPCRDCKP